MSVAWLMRRSRVLGLLAAMLWLGALGAPPLRAAGLTLGGARTTPAGMVARAPLAGHTQATLSNRVYFAEGYTGQGAPVKFTETLSLLNTNPITATGQIEYFLTGGITSTVPITIPARSQITENVAADVGANQQVSAVVQTDQAISATRIISRTTTAGAALGESISDGEPALSPYWYFAEGYTGVTFQEYMSLLNPADTPASVTIQPYTTMGTLPAAPITRTVPAHSRVTVNVRAALPDRSLGLLVQADQPIAAERTLYWGAGAGSAKYGSSVSAGVAGPEAQWLFPYASIGGGDQSFLALIDPNPIEAHARITFYGAGAAAASINTTVEPGARATVALRQNIAPAAGIFAVVVSSDVPVVCEEAQYFGGSPNSGSHAGSIVSGSAQPATSWTFPGFDTAPFTSERWFVLNINAAQAHLSTTFLADAARARLSALPDKLTSISLANIRDLQHGSASIWSSDTPVVVVEVVRGALPSSGVVVSGTPQPS